MYTQVQEAQAACQEVLDAHVARIGFDMEWRVKFKTGEAPCPVALVQLCYARDASDADSMQIAHSASAFTAQQDAVAARPHTKSCAATGAQLPSENGSRCSLHHSAPAPAPTVHSTRLPGSSAPCLPHAHSASLGKRARSAGVAAPGNADAALQQLHAPTGPDVQGASACAAQAQAQAHVVQARTPLQPASCNAQQQSDCRQHGSKGASSGSAKGTDELATHHCLLLHIHHSGVRAAFCVHKRITTNYCCDDDCCREQHLLHFFLTMRRR